MNKFVKKDIVPWKNPAEFQKVFEYAYSEDLTKNRWAIEQIAVWETRCWPSLPTAVEVTLLFLRAKIQDKLYEASKSVCNAQEVEMMYSNSVVRFVNLLVENDQNSKLKKRMSYLAAERNIPPWIVDIRHSCTHGFHPTLPVLRMAYETIMAYLREIFWEPESTRVRSIKKSFDEEPFVKLLQSYRRKQYLVVVYNDQKKKSRTRARNKVLENIDFILSKVETRKKFLNILVRDFVTKDDVNAMVIDDEIFMDSSLAPSSFKLPDPLAKFYYPLIKLLHKHDLISTFLELLLLSQEKRDGIILQKVVDYVVVYVLNLVNVSKSIDKELTKPFIHKGANLNLYRLLYSCVRGCSHSIRVVFERLVKDLNLYNFAEELSSMMNIKLGSISNEPLKMSNQRRKRKFDITFTVEDLELDVQEVLEKKKPRKDLWSLAPLNINWASTPIGHVFNPVDIAVKDEPQHESETSSVENGDNPFAYAFEESKPVVTPQPKNFIFNNCPDHSSLLYHIKN